MTRRLSRRELLGYGLGAAAVGSAPELAGIGWLSGRQALEVAAARDLAHQHELRQPRVLRSRRKRLRVHLRCRRSVVRMGAPQRVRTYTYNGVVPGHTWELRGGDTIQVELVNHLPRVPPEEHMPMARPHEWTTTNLHTHGLHVSPRGNSDNVFLSIPPGERHRYEIHIPEDHPAGLFWYHPHRHGGVTQQVRGGMAGVIVVRGDLDRMPEIRAAREQVLVLQAIELGPDYELLDPIPDPTKEQAFFPRKNVLYTVNGRLKPKITMRPGEVQRWRLLNAAEGKFMSLRLEDHDFHMLAWDGLTLKEPEGAEVAMLSAGNRVEVLVKAGRPGRYELMLTPGSSQKPNIPGMPAEGPERPTRSRLLCDLMGLGTKTALQDQPPELQPRSIATLVVEGAERHMRLPSSLPQWDPPILPIARRKRLEYTVARDVNEFLFFGIDGKAFDPDRPPYKVKLNTAEEWTIVNRCDPKLADHAHVFHIHTNPFKVTAINGRRLATPLWRDTWVLTGRSGDSFTFESNFVDFTGKFVQHCHVLAHEDLGMMSAVQVVP